MALLAEAAVLAAGRGEAAALAVLHDRLGDPLDAGVVADGGVGRVHRDHLKERKSRREENKTGTTRDRKKESQSVLQSRTCRRLLMGI